MMSYRIGQVAELLGVSVDTVRRWADAGRLGARRTHGGQRVVDGATLAEFVTSLRQAAEPDEAMAQSARNRFTGIVTRVVKDRVVAQVEVQAGPHRVVSLMTREAADELGLVPGMLPVAAVKATNVVVELPSQRSTLEEPPMLRSWIRSAALLAVVALLAAGCGGNNSSSGGSSGSGSSTEIKVFAAASLTAAANPNAKVTFNFAGSQALATQIQQSAPADVFASADTTNMDKVKDLVDTPQNFASNLLQIIVANGNPKGIKGLSDLSNPDLKVVLAAPDVPAGKYAGRALDAQHVTVKPVSLEDNVKAVVTKVSLGEADAGIVYVTDVTAGGDKVEGVDIPIVLFIPRTSPIATVKASSHQSQARAFMNMVVSDQGRQVLKSFGFLPPPAS